MKLRSHTTVHQHRVAAFIVAGIMAFAQLFLLTGQALAAACTAPTTDYGTVSGSVSIPGTATYRVWTRMQVPDSTNKTYLLELDGNKCYTVGGGTITANSWVWIPYQGGNPSSNIDVSLSSGSHNYRMIGNAPGVKVDRVIFTSDLTCVPTSSSGNECTAVADTTAPSAVITAPSNNTNVSGTVNITATASDNTAVSHVDFYVNSSLLGSDTSSPYSMSWDTTKLPNAAQLITVRAYDAANNVGSDSVTVNTSNGDTTAPSAPTGLAATATAYNAVSLSWKASTDNTAVAGYTVTRDGVPLTNVGNVTTFKDSGLTANTTYSYKVLAFDAAGNKSANSSAVSVTTPQVVGDTQAPTAPTNLTAQVNNSSQISLSWTASTDNTGVAGYDIYRGQAGTTPTKVASAPGTTTSYGDTNLSANTAYTYYVVAKDSAGNASAPSQTVTVTTDQPIQQANNYVIRGLVTNQDTGSRIPHATVIVTIGSNKHIYQANRSGAYAIQGLTVGDYNLTFRANGYFSKTVAVKVTESQLITELNVTLQKR